ncbi:MAG: hypothetical protein ACK4RK_01750 [Gemmataceae bacterium]
MILLSAAAKPRGGQDHDDAKPSRRTTPGLFKRWFGAKDQKQTQPEPAKRDQQAKDQPEEQEESLSNSAAEREQELNTLLRRLEVCDRLRDIAFQTQDEKLTRLADELDRRANAAYTRRTTVPGQRPIFESDEQILEDHLGAEADLRELLTEERGMAAGPQDQRNGRAAARGRKP